MLTQEHSDELLDRTRKFFAVCDELIERDLPVPVSRCKSCNSTIWRHNNRFQCVDCGSLSTEYGGIFPGHITPDFIKIVDLSKSIINHQNKENQK